VCLDACINTLYSVLQSLIKEGEDGNDMLHPRMKQRSAEQIVTLCQWVMGVGEHKDKHVVGEHMSVGNSDSVEAGRVCGQGIEGGDVKAEHECTCHHCLRDDNE
jgi:hypothetical protein